MPSRSLSRKKNNYFFSCRPVLALLAVLFVSCGPDWHAGGDADPYNGVIDNQFGAPTFTGTNTTAQGALAQQFQPFVPSSPANRVQCNGASSCYVPVAGFAAGKPIKFFIAGRMASSNPPFAPLHCAPSGLSCVYAPSIANHAPDGGGGWHADVFPHSCTPAGYDPVADAYPRDQQFPVANALPLNNSGLTSPRPPIGVVAVYDVSGVSGETCNDIKYADSIGNPPSQTDPGSVGKFGAVRSAAPTGYEVWMIFDPTVPVLAQFGTSSVQAAPINTNLYWYRGLQAAYLSAGPIPTDSDGSLVAMDGIILDPANSSSFEVPTTNNAVLLPAQPGATGFSPIVRLHDYRLSGSHKLGDYKGACMMGDAACAAAHATDFVKLSDATPSASNVVFITASPQ